MIILYMCILIIYSNSVSLHDILPVYNSFFTVTATSSSTTATGAKRKADEAIKGSAKKGKGKAVGFTKKR